MLQGPARNNPKTKEQLPQNAETLSSNTWPCVAIQSSGWWEHLPLGQAGLFGLDISGTPMPWARFSAGQGKR